MRFWLFLIIQFLLPTVYGLEPPPSGTPYGKFHVRVLDCSSQQPIAGASVTNMTGYAEIQGYAWFYTYYITASGYRFTHGERRFFRWRGFHYLSFEGDGWFLEGCLRPSQLAGRHTCRSSWMGIG
ncbi:MAG: hypothetical protein QXH32_10710 [Candidatus Caldarchaeum sp.]